MLSANTENRRNKQSRLKKVITHSYYLTRGLGGMNKKQIENLIYQYHWRKKEVNRLENILWGHAGYSRSVGVAQYGIEATLPKPNTNLKSYAELEEMDQRELRQYKRLEKFRAIVYFIEGLEKHLTNDKHLIIFDCMLEGMSYRSIADHLQISRSKFNPIKDEMLNQLCQKIQKDQINHYVHDLIYHKSTG